MLYLSYTPSAKKEKRFELFRDIFRKPDVRRDADSRACPVVRERTDAFLFRVARATLLPGRAQRAGSDPIHFQAAWSTRSQVQPGTRKS